MLNTSVRRVALTRHYTQLTAAARDPPDTNRVLDEYQATSKNLPELNREKPAKAEAKKEIHFDDLIEDIYCVETWCCQDYLVGIIISFILPYQGKIRSLVVY